LNAFVEVEDSGEEATHEKEKDAFSFIFSFFLSLLLKRREKVRITPFKRHPPIATLSLTLLNCL